ncbi:unnamed protein product [Laminaria digitata]
MLLVALRTGCTGSTTGNTTVFSCHTDCTGNTMGSTTGCNRWRGLAGLNERLASICCSHSMPQKSVGSEWEVPTLNLGFVNRTTRYSVLEPDSWGVLDAVYMVFF